MKALEGKIALITGALGDQGKVACKRFAAEGATIVATDLHDRGAEALLEQLHEIGQQAMFHALDIRDSKAIDRLADRVKSTYGGVDTIYNNAGVMVMKPLLEITNDEWDRAIGVNMSSIFYITRAFVPLMAGRKGCSITNISSMGGLRVYPTQVPYSASKAAVIQMTKSMAYELAPDIRVNAICPGVINTQMAQGYIDNSPDPAAMHRQLVSGIPLGRMGTPEDVVNLGVWLASEQAAYVTGAIMVVDGGSTLAGK
jgi:3-oxoacyl-[acyl-carrier protein] reductase/cyclopentanol dehydrogenase/dihydroanticapsin dehydrogenase